jgi:hypothetical protein
MTAIIICIVLLHKVVPFLATSYDEFELYSDNQGLVNKISEMMEWETHYPSNALSSEWDILSVILSYLPKLPVPPTVKYVKGLQAKDAPVATLSLPAQLNCEADALATTALEAIVPPIPQTPVFPSTVCPLDVSNVTVSHKLQAALQYSSTEPEMSKYLKDHHDWDDITYKSVCWWPVFSAARFTATNSRFVPKYCHRHLPVGDKANRNDSKYSPKCPPAPTHSKPMNISSFARLRHA